MLSVPAFEKKRGEKGERTLGIIKNVKHLTKRSKNFSFYSSLSSFLRTFAPAFERIEHWRDGRVVDYSSLENCRTERCRGFESLSLRQQC